MFWIILLTLSFLFILTLSLIELSMVEIRQVEKVHLVYNSFISIAIRIFNKIFSNSFVSFFNPITNKVHIVYQDMFNQITSESIIYKQQVVYILQNKKLGWFKFIVLYLINSRYGYAHNIFEKQVSYWQYQDIDESKINEELNSNLLKYRGAYNG